MIKRSSAATLLFAVLTLFVTSESLADLRARLQESNFNLLAASCPANEMSLQDVDGGKVSLSGYIGKVVILNFWKIDCPPCSAEKAILEKIYRKYGARGLTVLAVNLFDPTDRVKAYRKKGGFSFPFAIDPDKRFAIHQYNLASGAPTACVLNSNREAIYAVPAVPTTYLLNRNGQVVGSSFGMVNWEEQPFTELLESLLGPSEKSPLMARNVDNFARVARQGSNPTDPREASDTDQGSSSAQVQANPGSARATTRVVQATPLPFQPPHAPMPSAGTQPGPTVAPRSTSTLQQGAAGQSSKPAVQGQTGKKPKPAQAARVPAAHAAPQPYGSPTGGSPLPGLTPQRPAASTMPAIPAAPSGSAPSAPGATGTLGPLPPGIPYSSAPGRTPAATPPLAPDDEGNIMARIPAESASRGWNSQDGQPGPGNLPPAQPIGGSNPIGGFILDSFGQPRPTTPRPGGEQMRPPGTPPASVLGQLNEDLSALGSGIRDAFSRIMPSR